MGVLLEEDVSWIVRRTPWAVADLLKKYAGRLFLAGGFIRSCIAGEKASDIDLFAASTEEAKAFATEFAAARGSKMIATDNAFTVKVGELPIQFIHRWTFDNPAACVASFDFTIASAAVWFDAAGDGCWRSCCDERFYADLAARRLVYRSPIRNEDAGGSMLRVLKFYQRGYRCTLPSLGGVIARLAMGFDLQRIPEGLSGINLERQLAKVATGLLVEVDPNAIIGQTYFPEKSTPDTSESS